MSNTIYTATGCARCKITKRYMQEQGMAYDEFDFKAEGKEAFAKFYRANRSAIYRDKDGVEFPVFTDGNIIKQGVSVVIGYWIAGTRLEGFIGRSALHGEWIDGFDISGGDSAQAENLMAVLSYLKRNGLKIQLTTHGKNAAILEQIQGKGLGDRVLMEIKGPTALYGQIAGEEIEAHELEKSINVAAKFGEYQFYTMIAPIKRSDGQARYLTPEEIGETAKLIESATGSKKHPYELRLFDPQNFEDEQLKAVEVLPSSALFKYRTAARRYQVMTEIEKKQ